MLNVLISISTKIGVAPNNAITSAVAKYVNGVVNIASPGPTPLAIRAIINASVPLAFEPRSDSFIVVC